MGADFGETTAKKGGDFLFDQPEVIPAVWGHAERVLWAEGEPMMIAAPPGTGKSTTAQQLLLRRCGVIREPLLGLPVKVSKRPSLLLAMDRPRQIGRSMRRMVDVADDRTRRLLNRRLAVWDQPLPRDFVAQDGFVDWADALCPGVGLIVVDSLKDFVIGLSADEAAAAVNLVWQEVSAAGIELLVLHHDRKTLGSDTRENPALDDIYGSRWITAGMGSVVMFAGAAGDQEVTLHHVKQPSEVVGPMVVHFDRASGELARGADGRVDRASKHVMEVVELARNKPGMSSSDLLALMTTTTNNDARNRAMREAERQRLVRRELGPKNAKFVFAIEYEEL
ncbi:AAA family ATPase [Phytohabitans aurantiacus]|uniref:AAA+ ATPase domain-containing protein n=1 Tax=Phytohabitans aurantiacus TaxID=3016789 RepID=A0ABQ5R292_9ACTN|nr:AAA family ATPase [Phytohabitans aurantiacus]GLI00683.1 hypothetical protein Pa4123_59590 [Phytohabitans aurantiacus]